MSDFYKKVAKIQKELKAPKSQRNSFGNYNYRNQEDILEAVKPLLGDLVLTVNDEMVSVGTRIYVKATCTISDGVNSLSNTAFAREPEEKKGMDLAQLTGATSSYARKYSLNGLFLIDDTKDADTNEVTAAARSETVKSTTVIRGTGEKVTAKIEIPTETTTTSPENNVPKKPGQWGKKPAAKADGDLY